MAYKLRAAGSDRGVLMSFSSLRRVSAGLPVVLSCVIGCQFLRHKADDPGAFSTARSEGPSPSLDAGTSPLSGVPDSVEVATVTEFNFRVPSGLLANPRTADAARACAVAINNALETTRTCDTWNGAAKGVEAITAAAAIASTAMASQVSPGAKQHWFWAAIGFGAAFGVMNQVDTWLNCNERTFRQAQLASLRIAHLLNAAHLGICARESASASRMKAAAYLSGLPLTPADSKRLMQEVLSGTDSQAVAALDEAKEKSGAGTAGAVEAIRIVAAQPSAGGGTDGGVGAFEFQPQAADCIERAPDGGPLPLEPTRLWDRVNQELILCWSIRATPYGAFSANPNGTR